MGETNMRRARIDTNQPEIVAAFRQLGFSLFHSHTLGQGFPDLVVARMLPCPRCDKDIPQTVLVEIKDGDKPLSARKLTPDESRLHQLWRGRIVVVESMADVLRLAGANE